MSNLKKRVEDSLMRAFGAVAGLPFRYREARISPPQSVSHAHYEDYLSAIFNKPGMRILEIGVRNVTGANRRNRCSAAEYTGFDFYAGENVDVVGDVHKLSSYFPPPPPNRIRPRLLVCHV